MRRLAYLPGLLSLCLLWPLGVWYLWGQGELGRERCVKMTFPTPVGQNAHMDSLRWEVQPHGPIEFRIAGDLKESRPELERFRAYMEALARTQGTDTLRIRFGPDARYATVMHAVESCRLNTRVWWLEEGELITWYASLTPPPEPMGCKGGEVDFVPFCGTHLMPRGEPTPWPDRGYAAAKTGLNAVRPVWPALPLFALLVAAAWHRPMRRAGRSPEGQRL